MVQVAAALLFAIAAAIGVTVILAMLKNNEIAILSALFGEGAFPLDAQTMAQPDPVRPTITLRPSPRRVAVRTPSLVPSRRQPQNLANCYAA